MFLAFRVAGGRRHTARVQSPPARILVVEDDPPIRHALEAVLRSEGYEVKAEADGRQVSKVAEDFTPDLAILDVRLPTGPGGFSICRRLRDGGDVPIMFLTAAGSIDERVEGFAAGGDDYLIKPYEARELLARVEALLRRSGRLRPAVLRVGDLVIDTEAETVSYAGTTLALTPTEYRLLLALAQHRGQVLSKVQLLTRVWAADFFDTNLVQVHVSSLRRKLEAVGPRIIHTVRATGYVLRA